MSAPERLHAAHERLLTFEVASNAYALPIGCIAEVAEPAPLACIPTLPRAIAEVMNHHGDALPVLKRQIFFDVDEAELPDPEHVLVLTARQSGGPRWGIPVDRIVGLVDGDVTVAPGDDPVGERRSIDDRVVLVLDPKRLFDRAREVIKGSSGRSE